MSDPATALTRHDEDHGHYTDRPTLHDQLTAALVGALTEMWQPEVGHSCTGDLPALADDARTLARVAEAIVSVEASAIALRLTEGYEIQHRQDQTALMDADDREDDLKARIAELERQLAAIDRVHGTYHAGPDGAEYCTGCGRAHPCPTRTAAQ